MSSCKTGMKESFALLRLLFHQKYSHGIVWLWLFLESWKLFLPRKNYARLPPKANKESIGQCAKCCRKVNWSDTREHHLSVWLANVFWSNRFGLPNYSTFFFFSCNGWQLHKVSIAKKLDAVYCIQGNEVGSGQINLAI